MVQELLSTICIQGLHLQCIEKVKICNQSVALLLSGRQSYVFVVLKPNRLLLKTLRCLSVQSLFK